MVSNSSENLSSSSSSSSNSSSHDDPDYEPSHSTNSEDSTDEETVEEEEEEDEEEDDDEEAVAGGLLQKLAPLFGSPRGMQMPMMFLIQAGRNGNEEEEEEECEDCEKEGKRSSKRKRNRKGNDIDSIMNEYNEEERTYIEKLPKEEKNKVLQAELRIKKLKQDTVSLPMRFKILDSPMDDASKRIILAKLEQFQSMYEGSGEYYKLRAWLQAVNRLPLGRIKPLPIMGDPSNPMDIEKVSEYLSGIKTTLDETVYGHREAKEQILRILAQWITNPNSGGHCIGIQGNPGCGKTSLVKDGICRALNLPFSLISLGCYGSDGSGLTGHHVTYEGSTYGKISESLMKAQYMNPILYFDELDKISQTPKGEEVTSVLIHLTDSTQNDHFNDNYFSEIPLDLSKCLIIFSYNDESLVNPILKDRMVTIRVSGYTKKEKIEIAQNYLVPRLLKTYNLTPQDIVFDNSVIEEIIERVEEEQGVRNLKRGIDSIISWINMRRYVPTINPEFSEKTRDETSPKIEFPVKITTHIVKKYIKTNDAAASHKHVMASMYL